MSFCWFCHEVAQMVATAGLSLPLIQRGQMSVIGKGYAFGLVYRLGGLSLFRNSKRRLTNSSFHASPVPGFLKILKQRRLLEGTNAIYNWTASSKFGIYRLCEQRRFRRALASAQSRQNLRCSLIQAMNQEEPSDRKSDPWPL